MDEGGEDLGMNVCIAYGPVDPISSNYSDKEQMALRDHYIAGGGGGWKGV